MTPTATPATGRDPRELIASSPMSALQVFVVAVTVTLCALDGFDALAISFASPGIVREWHIEPGALGIVLGMDMLGMAIGAIGLGGIADRIGRRRTILGCLVIMTVGMAFASLARGVLDLSFCRIVTGIGIGGMLPTINATAAEFASAPRRDQCVSLMAAGYPLGAIAGGAVSAVLLRHLGWRSVFALGATSTALMVPLVLLWVPESVAWLCHRQPAGALARVNRGLERLGHAPVATLPPRARESRGGSFGALLAPGLVDRTLLITAAYFLHVTTFYFLLKWVPKIVVDMGFAASTAAGVLVWTNVGGATGATLLSLLTRRIGVRALTITLLVGSTVMVAVFGHGHSDLARLSVVCAVTGFCTNGAMVGIYAITARAFPTELRSTGSGFVLGFGRGGAVLAPAIAGYLFQAGQGLQTVALLMGAGSLAAAVAVAVVDLRPRSAGGD